MDGHPQDWKKVSEEKFEYYTLSTSDGVIAYVDTGGSGFPVFLIHGNSSSSRCFNKQLPTFGLDYRMIAVDLPGHGKSPDPIDPDMTYTIPGYARIMNEVASKLELESFAAIGFSLGGNIALQWSTLTQKLKGIMLISSAPTIYSEKAFEAYPPYEGSYAAYPDQLTEEQAEKYMSACGFDVKEPSGQVMVQDAMRADGRSRAKMVASVLGGLGEDETKIVSRLPIPLAIVIGSEDPALGIDYIIHLNYRNLWRGKVEQIPNGNHALIAHQTEELHPLIKIFLESL